MTTLDLLEAELILLQDNIKPRKSLLMNVKKEVTTLAEKSERQNLAVPNYQFLTF